MSRYDYDRLWAGQHLDQLGHRKASEAIEQLGMALPCYVVAVDGALVTVAFDLQQVPWTLPNITIPKLESPYFRMPMQVGDKGVTLPADASLSSIAGYNAAAPSWGRRGNLTALVFAPVSSKLSPPPNQTQAIAQGPGGALVQTSDGSVSINVTANGVTITVGADTWTFTSSGLTLSTGIVAETHEHLYTPGTGTPTNTGEPVAP